MLVAVGLLCSVPACAQQITGLVTDPQGAAVPNAAITVHNEQTGVDVPAKTTPAGVYAVPYLKPGTYTVKIEAKGFKSEEKTGVPLEQNQVSTINFLLQIGQVTETLTVHAEAPVLDFQRVSGGDTLTQQQISSLPLVSFNPFYNATLFAGAKQTYGLSAASNDNFNSHPENLMSINNQTFDITIDGIPSMQVYTTSAAYIPPTNMLQEMKVTSTPFDASMGFRSGGQIAMALKSGTNALHGTVEFQGQRSWLNANSWKNNYLGNPIASSKQDIYGFQVDGPVVIPHIYNGRSKAFFLLGYNKSNNPGGGYVTSSTPNPAWLTPKCDSGAKPTPTDPSCYFDFSSLLQGVGGAPGNGGTFVNIPTSNGGVGSAYYATPIYNPYSGHNVMEGSTQYVQRTAFPNNRIPYGLVACGPSYLSGVCDPKFPANYNLAKNLLSYFPAPNQVPTSGNLWQNNYQLYDPTGMIQRNLAGKIDYNLNDMNRFFISYMYFDTFSTATSSWGHSNPADNNGAHYGTSQMTNTFAVDFVHTFSANLVSELKGNVGSRRDTDSTGPGQGFDPTTLGFSSSLLSQDPYLNRFPRVGLGSFTTLGAYMGLLRFGNIMNLDPSVTWIKGAHTIRAGMDIRYMQQGNRTLNSNNTGMALSVGAGWTGDNDIFDLERAYCGGKACTNYPSGNSVASLLLGTWDSGTVNTYVQDFQSRHYIGTWFQDDWKVTPKLTLNLGVRYDLPFLQHERYHRNNWGFDYSTPNAMVNQQMAAAGKSLPNNGAVVGGLMFAGVDGNPTTAFSHVQTNLIEPRFGISYAINGKTVLHMGIAETAAGDLISISPAGNIGFTSSTSYVSSADNGVTPMANLANPFATLTPAPGASLGLNAGIGTSVSFVNPNGHLPTYWHFNLTIQRQLSSKDSLDFGFQGNRMYGGSVSQDINHISAAISAMCDYSRGGNQQLCDNTGNFVPNPFQGVAAFQGTSLYSSATINRTTLTRPYPQFGSITESWINNGRNSFNSFQVTERHRFQYGLTVTTSYTFSKTIDWGGWADYTNGVPQRVLDSVDIPHRLTINGSYELPIGRGRKFFSGSNRVLDSAIGGWIFAATFMRQSGMPQQISGMYMVTNPKVSRQTVSSAETAKLKLSGTDSIRGFEPCAMYYDNNNGGKLTWEPVSVAYGCTSPDFIVVPSYGITPNIEYSGIRMGGAMNFDANVSKVFTIKERLKMTIRMDAFNVLNHPMWVGGTGIGSNAGFNTSPGSNDFGTIIRGGTSGLDQSNSPRQVQLGAKITW